MINFKSLTIAQLVNNYPQKALLLEYIPNNYIESKIPKKFVANLINTIIKGYYDALVEDEIKKRNGFQDNGGDFIELKGTLVNIFDSKLYQMGKGRFLSLLKKKY